MYLLIEVKKSNQIYKLHDDNLNDNTIEKWYKFLQPDQLKISFNKETWEKK
ncbi:hypothetical protein [Spiroplasma endosymbiont of Seladonia tumulorum]|uniref:hypothetical protein n=1 Tax=Spiroplasma endosymbiont of Seladonia tumulorum TaxID=3066321 RepID=UPI0030CB6586